MQYLIKASKIHQPYEIIHDSGILVDGESISKIGIEDHATACTINLGDCTLIPGLIEMHIHGTNGFDTMDATYSSFNEISKYLAIEGVTSFLPTTVTSRYEKLEEVITCAKKSKIMGLDGSRMIGLNIEGPYISVDYKGAHNQALIREISIKEICQLLEMSDELIRIMTIAPEKDSALQAIQYLYSKNVKISLGHSKATYEQTINAISFGASIATHLFNGMSPLNHRKVGILGAILEDERVFAEIICDNVHVSIPAIRIALKCKENKIILISDSIMARGLSDGEYTLGDERVIVKNGIARTQEGSLAGSTLSLLQAVRTVVEKCNVSFSKAINYASLNPAVALGVDNKYGSIEIGKVADLVGIDADYNVRFVMIEGRIVFGL